MTIIISCQNGSCLYRKSVLPLFVTKFGMLVELLVLLLLPAVDSVVFVSVLTAAVGAEID